MSSIRNINPSGVRIFDPPLSETPIPSKVKRVRGVDQNLKTIDQKFGGWPSDYDRIYDWPCDHDRG